MDKQRWESVLCDAQYARRQLRQHRCVDRALDALDRIVELASVGWGDAREANRQKTASTTD